MANTIGTAYIQIEPTTKGIGGKIANTIDGEASSAGASAGAKLSNALGGALKVGLGAVVGASGAMAAFGKSAVDAGMTFDSAMSQVGATMGFSVEEINTAGSEAQQTMQQLRDFAQEMGSTTSFSASESAEALNYMALAGYDAETSMRMLPTVLNLAAAGGIGLAEASDMVTDAQSALGLSLEDTYIMVDEMAAASSKSNTSVAQLGEAFLTIGANAKNLSGGTTELATALGLLADNGIKGAEGGTHLRNIMMSLNPTTDKAITAWEKLGVSAYDADGNLRPLQDTFGDLNTAMEGMTDQEKTDILSKMFNKTDLASVNALLATSTDRWEELGEAIYYSDGAASMMADVQLDNLAGDITLFKSALEGAQIAVSDQLTPTLREFVQFGSDGIAQLTQAFQSGGLTGAMDAFGQILSDGLAMIISMLPNFMSAGAQLLNTLISGIVSNMPMIIEATLSILNTLLQSILENLPLLIEGGLQLLLGLAMGISQSLPELIPTIVDCIIMIVETLVSNADLLIDGAIALILGLTEGIMNAFPTLIEKIPELVMKLVEAFIANAPKLLAAALQLVLTLADGIIKAWSQLLAKIPQLVAQIKDKFESFKDNWRSIGANIVAGLWEGLRERWSGLVSDAMALGNELVSGVQNVLGIHSPSKVFYQIGEYCVQGFENAMQDFADGSIFDDVNKGVNSLNDYVSTNATLTSKMSSADAYSSGTTTTSETAIIDMLATYLPMIARGENINVTLQGDAKALFKSVQTSSRVFNRTTGSNAFA